jgi:hypothetical protein
VLAEPSTRSSTFEISLEEYSTVRQTLIECENLLIRVKHCAHRQSAVLANLAERLQDNVDPVNYKYIGFLVSMLLAMRDNYEVCAIALMFNHGGNNLHTRAYYLGRNEQLMLSFVERFFGRC